MRRRGIIPKEEEEENTQKISPSKYFPPGGFTSSSKCVRMIGNMPGKCLGILFWGSMVVRQPPPPWAGPQLCHGLAEIHVDAAVVDQHVLHLFVRVLPATPPPFQPPPQTGVSHKSGLRKMAVLPEIQLKYNLNTTPPQYKTPWGLWVLFWVGLWQPNFTPGFWNNAPRVRREKLRQFNTLWQF